MVGVHPNPMKTKGVEMSVIKDAVEMYNLIRILNSVNKIHFDGTYRINRRCLLGIALHAIYRNFYIQIIPSDDLFDVSLRITNAIELSGSLVPMQEIIAASMGQATLDQAIHKKAYVYLTRSLVQDVTGLVKGYGFDLTVKDVSVDDVPGVVMGRLTASKNKKK